MDFRRNRTSFNSDFISGEQIEVVEEFKYLGFYLDWTGNKTKKLCTGRDQADFTLSILWFCLWEK